MLSSNFVIRTIKNVVARCSRGMILALGARGPEFNSEPTEMSLLSSFIHFK